MIQYPKMIMDQIISQIIIQIIWWILNITNLIKVKQKINIISNIQINNKIIKKREKK
jgi:hypothetical protein